MDSEYEPLMNTLIEQLQNLKNDLTQKQLTSEKGVVFAVSLDGLNLSKNQIKQIDHGIKEAVMRELAKIDNKGDLIINRKIESNPKFRGFTFPIILGGWFISLPDI